MMDVTTNAANVPAMAAEVLSALDAAKAITPFSTRPGGLSPDDAYRITPALRAAFEARGERMLGRKVGFTNRRIWAEYNVYGPNWGYVTSRTLSDLDGVTTLSVGQFAEPRIEPEIIFGLAAAPDRGMNDAALLDCIAWVSLGYEIVQSIFPDWKFTAADSAAVNAMHGALLVGPRHAIAPRRKEWLEELSRFGVTLYRNGELADRGNADNVLDGPLSVVRHLAGMLADDPLNPPLAAGEIISTGTLTRAFPVLPGETWTATVTGIPLEPIGVTFK
jgi:2-oxo-3-hexenedioate decarboxylase